MVKENKMSITDDIRFYSVRVWIEDDQVMIVRLDY